MELWFMSEPIYIDRPPRIQPELPFDEIEIPSPPEKPEAGYTQLIQVGLPLITIIGYVMVATVGGGGRSPMLLIPMALSVVASVGFSIYTFRQEQQKLAEMALAYTERLVELNKEMHNYQDMQRRFYRYNYPDRLTTFRIVENARREVEKTDRTLRSESRLWERRVSDEDFGVIRLGMGTLPSTVLYKLGEVENFDDPQVREAMKLEEDSKYVSDIPVIITMRDNEPEKETKLKMTRKKRKGPARALHLPMRWGLPVSGMLSTSSFDPRWPIIWCFTDRWTAVSTSSPTTKKSGTGPTTLPIAKVTNKTITNASLRKS
jgi:S-DNA-T family DNA segregation ATPase FtsK/SpoIIIE